MATVATIIDSARYDLQDYETGMMWDDTELLNYLNRLVGLMQHELAVLDSELVEEEETDINTVADSDEVDLSTMNSGLWSNVKQVWIGQSLIEQVSLTTMRYKRIFRSSSSGKPYYWTVRNQKLLFEQECDQAYTTLTIYYNKTLAALVSTDDMPYDDRFNDAFVEALNMYATAKKDGSVSQINGLTRNMFRKRAFEEVVRREFVQKPYYIDF